MFAFIKTSYSFCDASRELSCLRQFFGSSRAPASNFLPRPRDLPLIYQNSILLFWGSRIGFSAQYVVQLGVP